MSNLFPSKQKKKKKTKKKREKNFKPVGMSAIKKNEVNSLFKQTKSETKKLAPNWAAAQISLLNREQQ